MTNFLGGRRLSQISVAQAEKFEGLFRTFSEELDNASGHNI